jgi:hypothetical protein
MKIVLKPDVAIALEANVGLAGCLEFSGFGFIEIEEEALVVYDYILLNLGSTGLTEIEPAKLIPLMDRDDAVNMRLWIHRHPIGNGIPGNWNWSLTDETTIQQSPLGGIPSLVKWSASIVRTPLGWVGRVDNHLNGKTVHVPVEPAIPKTLFDTMEVLHIEREARIHASINQMFKETRRVSKRFVSLDSNKAVSNPWMVPLDDWYNFLDHFDEDDDNDYDHLAELDGQISFLSDGEFEIIDQDEDQIDDTTYGPPVRKKAHGSHQTHRDI